MYYPRAQKSLNHPSNNSDTVEILQREAGFTNVKDKRYIATTRIGTCAVLWGYNKYNRAGFIIHLDFSCTMGYVVEALYLSILERYPHGKLDFNGGIIGGRTRPFYYAGILGGQAPIFHYAGIKLREKITELNAISRVNVQLAPPLILKTFGCTLGTFKLDLSDGSVFAYHEYPKSRKEDTPRIFNLLAKCELVYTPQK